MTIPGVLPRSLDPLPDEHLPGYLLRLAHRLEQSPHRIAQLLGLQTSANTIATKSALSLDTTSTHRIADAARLTPAEVETLLLLHRGDRYLPPQPTIAGTQRQLRGITQEPWLFPRSSRYCPQCLAGNGSTIERAHGGPWRTRWRLPVVFACTEHQQILSHRCPTCGQSPFSGAGSALIPSCTVAGLHPAQCRALAPTARHRQPQPCGTRLDVSAPIAASHTAEPILALQHKILDLLDADGSPTTYSAGHPVAPASYFADLRLIAGLISASWPNLNDAVRHLPFHHTLDAFLCARLDEITTRRRAKTRPSPMALHDRPPQPAEACAALLAAADYLLVLADTATISQHVQQMADVAPIGGQGWNLRIAAIRHDLSPGLNAALEPVLLRFAAPPRPGRRRPPSRRANFDYRHVPQRLPDGWFDPFFEKLAMDGPADLRRAAAIDLVRMVEGGTYDQARQRLGITRFSTANRSSAMHAWLRDNANARAYIDALNNLANHLDTITPLIDYDNRRQKLATWSIPEEQWKATVAQHSQPDTKHRPPPSWGDRKRRFVSWVVWTTVTSSERQLAPTSILPTIKANGPNDDRRRIIHYRHELQRATGPHARQLTQIIDAYVAQTITAVDDR